MARTDIIRPIHLRASDGEQVRVITDLVTIKAGARDTGGAYSLFEVETPLAGGCPPHTQRYDDETFYVLEGGYAFLIGDEEIDLGAGDYAFVPRGTVHAFTNDGVVPARMLVLVTPGGIQEMFFDEVGDRANHPSWEPDMARVLAVAPKYGVEFTSSQQHQARSGDARMTLSLDRRIGRDRETLPPQWGDRRTCGGSVDGVRGGPGAGYEPGQQQRAGFGYAEPGAGQKGGNR